VAGCPAEGKPHKRLPKDKDELARLLPEVNVIVGSISVEMLAKEKNPRA